MTHKFLGEAPPWVKRPSRHEYRSQTCIGAVVLFGGLLLWRTPLSTALLWAGIFVVIDVGLGRAAHGRRWEQE